MIFERWKTLSRTDPDFQPYLEGTFSRFHRALPVRSLNVDSVSEQVTFQIVPLSEIESPARLKVLWQMIRAQSLALSVGPMLVTLFVTLTHHHSVNTPVAVSSFLGVLFFHIAANLFNDYGDHIKGQDRVRESRGSRVIQNGWISAAEVNRTAWGAMIIAAFCGLPAILLHLAPIGILVGIVGLTGLEFAFQRLRLKARGWSEVVAFCLTGPLLTCGFAWAISGSVAIEDVVLGGLFGSLSLMHFHSANFENIMADSQAGVRTWATRAGFDASKLFFYFTAVLLTACALTFVFLFEPHLQMFAVLVFLGANLILLCRRVWRLASPLSSELLGLRWSVVSLCWFITALLTVSLAARLGGVS